MGISATQGEDVAAPGGIVSGAAGTGQEHTIDAAPETAGGCQTVPGRRGRVVIGLGVLAPKGAGGGTVPVYEEAGEREDTARPDPVFAPGGCDERIPARLNRKIARLEKRFRGIEERGRP
ncbi:MAG: hypothetical protein PHD55_11860 [Methanoregula sp.]|nr:hypothetical protein [Methanoregula sp.]